MLDTGYVLFELRQRPPWLKQSLHLEGNYSSLGLETSTEFA
jgi:hypothetical protein